jgi:hypothetical protein
MKKKKSNDENPISSHETKPKISFYKDFDDMENSRIQYNINTDVVTRIKNAVDHIKRIYGYDTMIKPIDKKIYFK